MKPPRNLAWIVAVLALPILAQAQGWTPSGDRTRDSLDIAREAERMMPDSVLKWVGMSREEFVRQGLLAATSPESLFMGPDKAHRSDADMKAHFLAHERDFLRLLAMFQADTSYHRIFVRHDDFSQAMKRVPRARYTEYERLMARTRVVMLIREGDLILLRSTTVHTFDRKGYVWSPRPQKPVVSGETHEVANGHWRVFKPLKPGWSIYFQPSS
jgi:hypothetical protein